VQAGGRLGQARKIRRSYGCMGAGYRRTVYEKIDLQTAHAHDSPGSRYPDLFSTSSVHDDALPRSEDLSTLASIVLSYATLYPETASRLSSLQTLQVPTAEQSARLIQLQPRLEECQKHEAEMEEEMRELRERSARCLEWWVKVGVVGIGDMWEQCERRIQEVERRLARCERRKREEDGYV